MVAKSDAMLQYEKSAGELMKNRPKHSNHDIMHLEVRNLVVIAAGLFFCPGSSCNYDGLLMIPAGGRACRLDIFKIFRTLLRSR